MRLSASKSSASSFYSGLGEQLYDLSGARPALDLNFASNGSLVDSVTGKSLITFTRASSGTYVDGDGIIQTAGNNVARFDHNPTTGESLGLLVEESRTNLITYSEDVSQSFSSIGVTVDLEQGTAPDGTNTANKLSGVNNTGDYSTKSGLAADTYTFSFWIKAVGSNTGTWGINYYDGSHHRSTVPVTTSWVRHSITFTSSASTNVYLADNREDLASLTEALVWGAQLEAGSFATSYIRTEGSTATRSADVASITGTNFSSWYNQTEGTVFSASRHKAVTARTLAFTDGTFNNSMQQYLLSNTAAMDSYISNSWQGFGGANITFVSDQQFKVISTIQTDSGVTAADGTLGTVDTSYGIPTVDRLLIGQSRSSDNTNGTISRLTYWPTRLSNDTLQTITR